MIIVIFALLLLGLCFGSFINALVWRIHKQSKAKNKNASRQYSILKGRSVCVHCGHKLSVRDLIPVLSWLSLGGKCRYCRKKIEDSPWIELITALLFAFSYVFWPHELTDAGLFLFITWLPILVLLIALFVYDLRRTLLPDKLTFALAGAAAVQLAGLVVFFGAETSLFWGALLGMACLGGLFYVLFQVSGGRWIGGGDVKFGLGLGILAGSAPNALLLLFLASAIGTVVSIGLIMRNKASKKAQIPFGPFLVTAAIIVQLFGQLIIAWYERQFLFI